MPKKFLVPLGVVLLLAAVFFGWLKFRDTFYTAQPPAQTQNQSNEDQETNQQSEQPESPAGLDKEKYALDQPASPWWVVNKTRPLPDGYEPPDLVLPEVRRRLSGVQQMQFSNQAVPDLKAMFQAAADNGVTLVFGSGYRSEALQRQFYNSYVAQDGQAAADRYSARPGTSEHQTGLSFDATSVSQTCHLQICFENTPEGSWLREHAHKYGFIIRYPEGKEGITGYQYEPWHMRWVGRELAKEMHSTGVKTLEEFFGLPAAPAYP